jgi:UDP-GlcNAc:undecaprenyl-phosphate/decaprenyl-phosphate GlcNAc-1-phosphate transferase
MYSLALLGLSSFLLAISVTPVVRYLARRWGLVDVPRDDRRVHVQPVPHLGGVAIVIAFVGAFVILLLSGLSAGSIVREARPFVEQLMPAAFFIFLVGLVDDIWGLKPWQKLIGQLIAASLAIWAGITVDGVAGLQLAPWLGIPVTMLWLVGCANAFNLVDGIDGLATGVGLFATVTMLLAALIGGNVPLAIATVPLVGALLGFIRFNFNPASIFLGDSGSLTVGFLIGCYGVVWGQKSATVLGLTAPLMAIALPLLETGLSVGRRFLRGQPVWKADRSHIHHRLLDRGLNPRRVALLLYGVAAIGAMLSVAQSSLHNQFGGLIIVIFAAAAWVGIRHLGYVEFDVAGRMFVDGALRRQFNAQIALQGFEKALREATSPEECWVELENAAKEFGYDQIRARLAGQDFIHTNGDGNPSNASASAWSVQIPLNHLDYVRLERYSHSSSHLDHVGPFADAIRTIMQQRLSQPGPLAPIDGQPKSDESRSTTTEKTEDPPCLCGF